MLYAWSRCELSIFLSIALVRRTVQEARKIVRNFYTYDGEYITFQGRRYKMTPELMAMNAKQVFERARWFQNNGLDIPEELQTRVVISEVFDSDYDEVPDE